MNRRLSALIVLLFLSLAAAAGVHAARTLRIDTRTEDLISSELDFQRNQIDYENRFPRAKSSLVAVIDAATPERAEQAADLIAADLTTRTDLFAEAYRPDGGEFFDRHGLLFLSAEELDRLSTRLADAQPFLGRLVADTTVRGLSDLLAEALDRAIDAPADTLARLIRSLAETIPDAAGTGPVRELSWRRAVADDPADEPETQRIVLLRPNLDTTVISSKADAVAAVDDAEVGRDLASLGARVRVTGPTALERDELDSVLSGMRIAGPLSVVLVAGLLFLAMRSFALVNASLLTLAVGLMLTLGFATFAVGRLNLISVAFGVLYVGLGADFAIHLALNIRARRAEGFTPPAALRCAVRDVLGSLCICAITTMVGFYVFIPTSFDGVSELGIIAGTGMVISLITTLTLFPALMAVLPSRWKTPPKPVNSRRLLWLIHAPERHRAPILISAAIITIIAAALIPGVRFDTDPLNLRDQRSESVRTLRELRATHGSDHWSLTILARDEHAAAGIRDRLAESPHVDKAVWLGSFIPEDQDAKLALVDDLALILGPTLEPLADPAPAPTLADTLGSLQTLNDALSKTSDSPDTPGMIREAAVGLSDRLMGWIEQVRTMPPADARRAADRLRQAWLGTFPLLVERIRHSLTANFIERDSLPASLRERWLSDDGTHRVEAFPSADLGNPRAMREFIASVRGTSDRVVGTAISHTESGDAVISAFRQALLSAFIAVAIIALLAFRSALTAIETLAPFLIGGAATVAAMVILDQPFNFANVIALPLLMGVGIDSAIHLVHRSKAGTHDRLLESATARGVLFSALTTIAGFGSLAFSPHPGMASMGLVLSIGMASMLVSTLIVLPALLTFRAPTRATTNRS